MSADVKKMYRQVTIHKDDRNWYKVQCNLCCKSNAAARSRLQRRLLYYLSQINLQQIVQNCRTNLVSIQKIDAIHSEKYQQVQLVWCGILLKIGLNSAQIRAITERNILSEVSKLQDPNGYIAPIVIHTKMFIQRLWQRGLEGYIWNLWAVYQVMNFLQLFENSRADEDTCKRCTITTV